MPRENRRSHRSIVMGAVAGAVLAASVVPFLPVVGIGGQAAFGQAADSDSRELADPPKPATRPGAGGGAAASGDLAPGGLMDQAADSGSQVYVPVSFASVELIRTANRFASQGQNELAINAFQKVINQYGSMLVFLKNDSYMSITDYVREKLLAMPAVKEGMYDQLYGAEAKHTVDAAERNHDLAGLILVCDRYFPATAARDGLSQAAEWYFERGEFAGAARTWQLLLTHPMASNEMRALYLFRAAVSESLAGNKESAQKLRERLEKEYPDASGPVDGKDTALTKAADEILALPPLAVAAAQTDEWPAFEGGPTHSALMTVESSIGARLWSVDLNGDAISGERNRGAGRSAGVPMRGQMRQAAFGNQAGGQQAEADSQALNGYPVMSNGTLFIHTGERVVAMSVNAGTLQWAYPPDKQVLPQMDAQQVQMMRNYGNRGVPSSHDSVAVAGDQAFAVLPAERDVQSDNNSNRRFVYGMVNIPNTQMVCLSRQTGKLLWSTVASKIKLDKPGSLSFIGSPIVTQQGVYAMARKAGDGSFTELYLVRLDRNTGEPTWSCYLCSASSGAYYMPIANMGSIPIPTIVDDVAYVSTGQGTDCAVDANVGRILWLQITDTAKQQRSPNEMYNPVMNTTPSWKFNPPQVAGDKLITCETTESMALLRIYNRWTGKLLRSTTKKDLGFGALDVLAGVVDSKAIFVGSNVCAIDINSTDKSEPPAWTVDFPLSENPGKPEGRPFLSKTALYIPCERGMFVVDPRVGKGRDFWPWPRAEKDVDGKPVNGKPGNLLVTSEQVIVQTDDEVAGYSKWETARDNRLASIKQRPSDPEPYLALAEISFRTSHLDLAEDNMKRAVDLTNGSTPVIAGLSQGEMLDRLYRTNLNFAEQLLADPDTQRRDRSRFYFEQCKLAARGAEQQAEWRLCMSDLSLAQNKPDEAAELFNQVLTDPNMRSAPYHREDELARAGVTAEDQFRKLIHKDPNGRAVYRRYEDQAQAMLNKARAAKDSAMLSQVVDSYPNSASAIAAATDLAGAAREAHNIPAELKSLYWMLPRVDGEKKAQVTADTAAACMALAKPHFGSALAWTERGLRSFKDYTWKDPATQETMTFASLRDKLRAMPGAALVEGRLPALPAPAALESLPADPPPLVIGDLLTPVEQNPALRRPDLLFAWHDGCLHIFDTAHHTELTTPQTISGGTVTAEGGLPLPDKERPLLMGCVGDTAVLAQARSAFGVDLKHLDKKPWEFPFAGAGGPGPANARQDLAIMRMRMVQQQVRQQIVINNGNRLIIQNGLMIDPNTGQIMNPAAVDQEMARQLRFASLGRPGFTTLGIINDKLIETSNDKLFAANISTGKSVWGTDSSGAPAGLEIPINGIISNVLGNEDVIVVQVDSPNQAASTFYVFDTETGKIRKQFKLQDNEHAQWRGVSDDGVCFIVTDRAVSAYDLFSDKPEPAWRRTDLHSDFPAASLVTLDGLIFVNGREEVMCLSSEGGEKRWPSKASNDAQLPLVNPVAGQMGALHSALIGDTVVYQSGDFLKAFFTQPQAGEQSPWSAELFREKIPPLQSFEVAERYIVTLAEGPADGAPNAVYLVFYDTQRFGKLVRHERIGVTSRHEDGGPSIRAWQVADNGIAMEVNDKVVFWHGK